MLIGHTLKGRYRIYDRLGVGGAATVYLARDLTTGQMVIVKLVHPHLVNDRFIARFEREIDLLQQIDSPYIIQLYNWALQEHDPALDDTLSYIVAEFVQGHTLADIIDTRGKMAEQTALAIVRQVALGLSQVHARNVVHRDVKSQNVMITPGHAAKIIDFGIAKGPEHITLTDPEHFAGTLFYAPPEQILESSKVDERADLYALGVVLYEMLMASLPIQDREFGVVANRIIVGDLDPIWGVSEPVERLVKMMMAPNLTDRVASADDVVAYAEEIIGPEIAPVLPELPPGRAETLAMLRAEEGNTSPETMPYDVRRLGYVLVTPNGHEINLEKGEVIVGRSHPRDAFTPDVDLGALGVENARTASRQHCRLFLEDDVFFLEDLGSMNGTRLNDTQVKPGDAHRLTPGDVISAGRVALAFKAQPR